MQGQGKTIAQAVKHLGVIEQTFYRCRLWLNDGSSIRLAPQHRNHVWSWDFVFDRTRDGKTLKLMVVIDKFTRKCLAIYVARAVSGPGKHWKYSLI